MQSEAEQRKPPDFAPIVAQIVDRLQMDEMLLYGTLAGEFVKTFKPSRRIEIEAFHESLVGSERPAPSDLVVSIDHLHNVGMLRIEDVLDELRRLVTNTGFFHVRLASVEDFEQASFVPKPPEWWLAQFVKRFELSTYQRVPGGFYVIVYPRAH